MNRKQKFLQLKGKTSELNILVKLTHKEVFDKTNCLDCGNCCKSAPPLVSKSDIKRIAKHLNISTRDFKRSYVLEDFDGSQSFDSVPCKFLGKDNACAIYEVRPQACRSYPHTDDGDFIKRIHLHEINAKICPAVDEILNIMETKISKHFNQ
jgi:Fe-S-cluster containining protein